MAPPIKRSRIPVFLVILALFVACLTIVYLIRGDQISSKQLVISPSSGQSSVSGTKLADLKLENQVSSATSRLRDPLAWITDQGEGGSASDKCSAAFGLPFLQSWKEGMRQDLCEPSGGANSSSRMIFYPVKIPTLTGTAFGRRENLAMEVYDVVLNSEAYANGFQKSSVRISCKVLPAASAIWEEYAEKRGGQAALKEALSDGQPGCGPGAQVVDHPVLLLHRYDTTNAYHNLEDVLGVFMTLAMINSDAVKSKGIQVRDA